MRQQWKAEEIAAGIEQHWTVEFDDAFAAEVRHLPQAVREKLKAAAIILSENGPTQIRSRARAMQI